MNQYNKYLNPINYLRRAWYFLNFSVIDKIDRFCLYKTQPPLKGKKPIFIVGPPRGGSTLLTQLITDAFDLGTFTNRHSQLFGSPILMEKLFSPLNNKPQSNYKSNYGITKSPSQTSEGSAFWYRFFPRKEPYATLKNISPQKLRAFANTVRILMKMQKRSILFKNLYATIRIRPILKTLPDALFIVIQRNEVECAYSILKARMDAFGTHDRWWSVPTPTKSELLSLPPEAQVVEQIRELQELVRVDFIKSGADSKQLIVVKYESLCDCVHTELSRIQLFFQENGVDVTTTDLDKIPKTMSRRKRFTNVNPLIQDKIKAYVQDKKI